MGSKGGTNPIQNAQRAEALKIWQYRLQRSEYKHNRKRSIALYIQPLNWFFQSPIETGSFNIQDFGSAGDRKSLKAGRLSPKPSWADFHLEEWQWLGAYK
jgi:hypothetical protein